MSLFQHRNSAGAPAPLLDWFIRFRFGAGMAALLGGILAREHFESHFSAGTVLAVGSLILILNLLFSAGQRGSQGPVPLKIHLVVDILLLSILLMVSGGALNPLSILYLVYISLSGVLAGARFGWFIWLLSALLYGALFLIPSETHHHSEHGSQLLTHLQGMWLSLVGGSALLLFFQSKILTALTLREREISELRTSQERLASLTNLAAGAAHELGSPLATIAVITGELQARFVGRDAESLEELNELQSELVRCRTILDRLSGRSGDLVGVAPETFSTQELLYDLKSSIHPKISARLMFDAPYSTNTLRLPKQPLLQSLRALIENSFHASAESQPISLTVQLRNERLNLQVSDLGCGMEHKTLARLGEPFFTTKSAGQSMGLGVFLTRLFAEQIGGKLLYESIPGRGTTATLILPTHL